MTPNVNSREVAQFTKLATDWWNKEGAFKALHDINPIRVKFISDRVPLINKKVLDIGCGGGILAESLAKHGADVTGIDMSEEALAVASTHALAHDLTINYAKITAEELAVKTPNYFDIIVCMELLEHVPDPCSIVAACARLVQPDGSVFFATVNRSIKAYILAILGAEYVLRLLPPGTHNFAKFLKPSELEAWARSSGLQTVELAGVSYNPFTSHCKLTSDLGVNYLMHAKLL